MSPREQVAQFALIGAHVVTNGLVEGGALDIEISEEEALRSFFKLLRKVREGNSFTITDQGEPIARFIPMTDEEAQRHLAKARLMEHLKTQEPMNIPITWSRQDLYDDE